MDGGYLICREAALNAGEALSQGEWWSRSLPGLGVEGLGFRVRIRLGGFMDRGWAFRVRAFGV